MTAPRGTHPFTSIESRAAESTATQIMKEELDRRPEFRLEPALSFSDLLGGVAPKFAYQRVSGEPTRLEPDPGFILYKGSIVAIPEVKYQVADANAVERCFRWLAVASLPTMVLPLNRLFFAFYGEAFVLNEAGHISGQGGGVIELCAHLPIRLLVNATAEEVREEFVALLDEIERNER